MATTWRRWLVVVPVVALAGCAGVGGNRGRNEVVSSKDDAQSSWAGTAGGAMTTMGFGGEDEVGQSRVAAFEAANPDVTVTVNPGDFDAQQFLTALASGNPPDVVSMDRTLIGSYAAKGAIQPLDACIAGQSIDASQYRPAAMRSVTYDGHPYGIPEFSIVQTDLVDAKTLKAEGVDPAKIQTRDWDALAATAKQLYRGNGSKIQRIGFDPKLPGSFPLWARINGVEIVGEDGAPHLDDPKAVEALEYTVGLVEAQGGWTNFKSFRDSFDIFGADNPLTKGTITAFPMENWYVNVLRDSLPKGLQLESEIITDRQGKPVSMLGGSAWVIPKGAKNPVAACQWAKTMTSTDTWMKAAQARMQTVEKDKSFFTGLFTANTEADEQIREQYLTPAPDAGFAHAIDNYYSVLDKATAVNPSPAGAEIDAAWQSAVSRALEGTPAAQALQQAQKEAESAYEKAAR